MDSQQGISSALEDAELSDESDGEEAEGKGDGDWCPPLTGTHRRLYRRALASGDPSEVGPLAPAPLSPRRIGCLLEDPGALHLRVHQKTCATWSHRVICGSGFGSGSGNAAPAMVACCGVPAAGAHTAQANQHRHPAEGHPVHGRQRVAQRRGHQRLHGPAAGPPSADACARLCLPTRACAASLSC